MNRNRFYAFASEKRGHEIGMMNRDAKAQGAALSFFLPFLKNLQGTSLGFKGRWRMAAVDAKVPFYSLGQCAFRQVAGADKGKALLSLRMKT